MKLPHHSFPFARLALLVAVGIAAGVSPARAGDPAPDSLPMFRLPMPDSVAAAAMPKADLPATATPEAAPPLPGPQSPPAPAAPTPDASSEPSQNAMVNLINLLVAQGTITKENGEKLIRQANQEADAARARTAATELKADRALATQSAPTPEAPQVQRDPGEIRVGYVPEVVKQEITDQVTQNVLKETREDEAAAHDDTPDWVKRFRVSGDIRTRYESDFYPSGNAVGNFTNFNSINTGSGFNVNSFTPLLPQYNADQDRTRFRLRARVGAGVDLGDGFDAGMRIATGSDDSPASENQTLGAANSAQGGNFGKYQIWLDRAFIRYELGGSADRDLAFEVGRFDNPFFHTSMIWSDDVAFDGAVVQGKYQVAKNVTPFLTLGAFPVFNTDLNFSTNNSVKYSSEDKYLFGLQGGTTWKINNDFSFKGAVAYYDFENIEGKVSSPINNAGLNAGDTDDSRPAFAQNGNTYIALRDFEDPTVLPGGTAENEYYGLATPFHELALTGQLDFAHFDPFHLWLTAEAVKNLAFERNAIINNGPAFAPGPQNNTTGPTASSFDGGDTGYFLRFNVGRESLEKAGQWNANIGYRYVESDATVDGFTDTDFGGSLAGTNLKGYVIGGNVALAPRVSAGLRWISAESVAGPAYKNDLIQVDLNAKF